MMTTEQHLTPGGVAAVRSPLLEVRDLSVEFRGADGWQAVAQDVSFEIGTGEIVGLVGESGSGKTVSSLAILGLIEAQGGRIPRGSIRFDGRELVGLPEREMKKLRGAQIGMVFQQAMRSLNPGLTAGAQIAEVVRLHRGSSQREAWARAVEMLDLVGIPEPGRRAKDYPHQLSGGQCQRVMIAMALACDPKLLIADEPTTALDVTVQRRILELLVDIQSRSDLSILFISHDLAVIAEMCDRVVVMYASEILEEGTAVDLFTAPRHPYTQGLLDSIPQGRSHRLMSIPGVVPSPYELPEGCYFTARCRFALEGTCDVLHPSLEPQSHGRMARCHRSAELELRGIGAT